MTVTTTDIPDWFSTALAFKPETGQIESGGTSLSYRAWGEPSSQNVIMVHGGAAHSRWWDHIAPLLATGRRVVTFDLSGHGDSGRRAEYSIDAWASEVLEVATQTGIGELPIVIGHSLGGLVTQRLAASVEPVIGGAIIIDSPVATPAGDQSEQADPVESPDFASPRRRLYSTRAEVVSRFRPVPAQSALPYVRDHIAENSVRETPEGWGWKFDPHIFGGHADIPADLSGMSAPVMFFLAEFGLRSPGARATLDAAGVPVVEMTDAGHAPMLDQPLALVTGLRAVLAEWARA
jgi:pimeloyl-ACP methyl ester carboxylesterase